MKEQPKDAPKKDAPSVTTLLNTLGSAVDAAKAKGDAVAKLKADLASYTAKKQTEIDAAQTEYDDARVAAERLQGQVRELIGVLLPVADPRIRMSQ